MRKWAVFTAYTSTLTFYQLWLILRNHEHSGVWGSLLPAPCRVYRLTCAYKHPSNCTSCSLCVTQGGLSLTCKDWHFLVAEKSWQHDKRNNLAAGSIIVCRICIYICWIFLGNDNRNISTWKSMKGWHRVNSRSQSLSAFLEGNVKTEGKKPSIYKSPNGEQSSGSI